MTGNKEFTKHGLIDNYYDHTSVRGLKCINCGILHHFDGYEKRILIMGVCVVSYSVLRS